MGRCQRHGKLDGVLGHSPRLSLAVAGRYSHYDLYFFIRGTRIAHGLRVSFKKCRVRDVDMCVIVRASPRKLCRATVVRAEIKKDELDDAPNQLGKRQL